MPKLYATKEVVNGHTSVQAALDDPFWVGEKGYSPEPPDEDPQAAESLDDFTRDELAEMADELGVEVEGSGRGGYVTKADLVQALGG